MMGSAQLHDPEGDRLIALAESRGGAENLGDDLKWRLARTLDHRRKHAANATQQSSRRTDALDGQANERRFAAVETRLTWLKWMVDEALPEVIGSSIGEAGQRANADVKKLLAELRAETDQKLNAQFSGFETVVGELRGEDRAVLLENVRQTLSEAESRIDAGLAKALEETWARCELEIALVRDEVLNIVAEKRYGQPTDADPKLAERAIAELRKQMRSIETQTTKHGTVIDQLGDVREALAALEGEHRKATKSLFIRASANHLAARKQAKLVEEQAGKIATMEAAMAKLIGTLLDRKIIE